ncbi:MAG: hypothetical protein WCD73_14965 [Pseudolabrys sp.]
MFQALLRVTGLDRKLQTLKLEIESKANQTIGYIKAVGLQIAVATALAVAGAIFATLAILAGFVALFVWLQPLYGTLPAIGIVAGASALIALVFTAIAVVFGRRRPEPINLSELASMIRSSEGVAETDRVSDKAKPAASPSSSEIDSALDVVRLFAKSPKTGIEPIDNLIRAVEPRAEEVAREAAQRAATLVQTGDRKTMIAILGAAAATGWLIAKSGSLAGKQVVTDGDNPNKSS